MSSSEGRRAASATVLMVLGRVVGLALRLAFVATLGIAAAGTYAAIVAGAGLFTTVIDAYHVVRTPRTVDEEFAADRSSRWWTGAGLALVGAALLPVNPIAGLVLAKAGADIAFNALQAAALRRGHPDLLYAWDAVRQAVSTAVVIVVVSVWSPDVLVACGVYVAALVPFSLWGMRAVLSTRPRLPRRDRGTAVILGEATASAAYVQGDVVLLGLVAGAASAGYYSFASLAVWLAALAGQNLASAHHEELRARDGALSAGPSIRSVALLAGLALVGMLAIAGLLASADAPKEVVVTFLVMAPVGATRVWGAVLATVLVVQHRDQERLALAVFGAVLKSAGVLALAGFGAIGAAIAFLVVDLVATAGATVVARRRP